MTARKQKAAAASAPVAPVQPAAAPEQNAADALWDKIAKLPLELYSLPDQTLSNNCTRVKISPDQLHLKLNSGAVVSALADALKNVKLAQNESFDITTAGAFTVVKIIKTFF